MTKYYTYLMQCLTLRKVTDQNYCTFASWNYLALDLPEAHTHTFHELFWVESGSGIHAIHGEKRVLTAGHLVLVHASDAHAFAAHPSTKQFQFVNFAFPAELWESLRQRHFPKGKHYFDLPDYHQREYRIEMGEMGRLRQVASDLFAGDRSRLSSETLLMAVLALLENRAQKKAARVAPDWLENARERISVHPHYLKGVSEFVRFAARSPEHVARECQKHWKMTPSEVVNVARLEHAATRLATSGESISDIAAAAGFENLGYFYRLFLKKYQMTPRSYQLHHRQTEYRPRGKRI